ncbi:MAG: hypothetical protein EBU96_09785 [Actinobacteria bacterium]|jgi:hypothetical protein|nr:hypothetical protein [Actinomycetota bacterium]
MKMTVTNLTEIVTDKRKSEVVDILQKAMDKVENDGASNVLILLKTDGVYSRFSTSIDDVMEVIAQLEVLKYDILMRMQN